MAKKSGKVEAKRTSREKASLPPKLRVPKPGLTPAGISAQGHFPIVGLGASAGGLEAFTAFLKALPAPSVTPNRVPFLP